MKTTDLPPLLPFRIAAAALKSLYVLLNVTVIMSGFLLALVLAAAAVYGFHVGWANAEGGPGPVLLGIGAGGVLSAAALPLGLRTIGFAGRFVRAAGAGRSEGASRSAPSRTLAEAYRGGKSLSNAFALVLLGAGLFSLGIGMAMDGLQMLMFPGVTMPFER